MVDSVADWDLRQVIEHIKKKEKEEGSAAVQDTRVYSRSCIRFLNTIVDEVASEYDVSRGRMCRCLTYHGSAIMDNDRVLQDLLKRYRALRKLSVEKNDPDIADIINSLAPYTPRDVDASKTSFRVYDSWMLADLDEKAQACGVFPGQLVQILILRSILTCDVPAFAQVMERLTGESRRWDMWMNFRLSVLEVAVARWESLL